MLPVAICLMLVIGLVSPAAAQDPEDPDELDVAALDIDELARVQVTSVGRKSEPVAEAAAAVTVLTREDIRRLGVSTLPEVFRVVPGLQVARAGSRDWAISARGFNEQSSNKLLMMVDGRTVYSPVFAGVYWDVLSVPIDEIDRIEIIRGPGGAAWGANAVNGVINVITREARESLGGRVALAAGTWDKTVGSLRYGAPLGEGAVRGYVLARDRDGAELADGSEAADEWRFAQAGFRADLGRGTAGAVTVQGDAYVGEGGNRVVVPTPEQPPYREILLDDTRVAGGNLMGRWSRAVGDDSEITAQTYYSFARREQDRVFGVSTEHTLDVELQHRFAPWSRHDVVWGVEYRLLGNEVTGGQAYGFDPPQRTTHLLSAFVQDEITLAAERLSLTLGTKAETNSYTGFELQPTARIRWTPGGAHALWASVSRAVRTPSRIDDDAFAISAADQPGFDARLVGSDEFEAETMIAYEAGYRAQPHSRLSLELALFRNEYEGIRTLAIDTVIVAAPRPIVLVQLRNLGIGRTSGAELAATWRTAAWMRLRGSYSYLDSRAELVPGAPVGSAVDAATGNNAEHQASLWASFDLLGQGEIDLIARHVGPLEGSAAIPEYTTADVRLGWRVSQRLQLAVVGQDLLESRHAEFGTSPFVIDPRLIERRGSVKLVWRF